MSHLLTETEEFNAVHYKYTYVYMCLLTTTNPAGVLMPSIY